MSERPTDPWGDPCFRDALPEDVARAAEDAAWAAAQDLGLPPVFVSWVGTSKFWGPYALQKATRGEVKRSQPDRIRLNWDIPRDAAYARALAAHEVRHLWQFARSALRAGRHPERERAWAEDDADAYAGTIADVIRRAKGTPPTRAEQLARWHESTDRQAIAAKERAMNLDKLLTLDHDTLARALKQINDALEPPDRTPTGRRRGALKSLDADLLVFHGAAVKATPTASGTKLSGLAVVFDDDASGFPTGRDRTGEYFTSTTYFGASARGGAFTTDGLFHHGLPTSDDPRATRLADEILGDVTMQRTDAGWLATIVIPHGNDTIDEYVLRPALAGKLGWSTGSAPHAVRKERGGKITRWPIVEVSLTPTPAEPRALALPIKSLAAAYPGGTGGHQLPRSPADAAILSQEALLAELRRINELARP
jgi:hypothetical protein